jgi:hypothetical protein
MFVFVIAASCDKDNEPEWLTSKAKITYTGLIAVDGCGWMITLPNNKIYKPEDLPEEFMINDLEVMITYKILKETYRCGFTPPGTPPHQMIRIDKIEKI